MAENESLKSARLLTSSESPSDPPMTNMILLLPSMARASIFCASASDERPLPLISSVIT